jgi:hypothetical protein
MEEIVADSARAIRDRIGPLHRVCEGILYFGRASSCIAMTIASNEFALSLAAHAEHDAVADLEIPRYRRWPPPRNSPHPDVERPRQIHERRNGLIRRPDVRPSLPVT